MTRETPASIRDVYKQITHAHILDTAEAIICETGEASVTISSVAARARVSDRTVYRHFKTRDALVQSVWKRLPERVGPASTPRDGDELIETPILAFPRYDDQGDLLRAYLRRQAKRRGRAPSSEKRRKELLECVRSELPSLDDNKLRRRAAIVELLISATAWDRLSRVWDFDGVDAGDAAAEALQVLLGRCPAQ